MKKFAVCLLAVIMLSGCTGTKPRYTSGMFTDVLSTSVIESAVKLCVEEGLMEYEGTLFGIDEPVTVSEFADVLVKLTNAKTDNPIEYVIKTNIAPEDFEDWDAPVNRETVAYMLARAIETTQMNLVSEGAIDDANESFAKEEIYSLYKMGIFSGEEFNPQKMLTRADLVMAIEKVCDETKREVFSMEESRVSFVAFGDTIGHGPVLKAGKTDAGYDFDSLFENVKPVIEKADIACVNQETVFVENSFTSYPSFGSPKEIGIAEVEAGFDVITHATNHAFDRGEKGVLYTTDFWNDYNVAMIGIHEDAEDAEEICVIEKNGIKIALLNYTYSLNGYQLPKGKEYLVDLLDEDKIKRDMEKARSLSDAIVVFAHWGNEYQTKPAQSQKDWAQLFADNGATVIVGHHPHVVQPLEYVLSSDGRSVPVYYSLGNFISNQNDYITALCAMADFEIVKDSHGVRCEKSEIEPVITHMESSRDYSAYLLEEYPEEELIRHKFKGRYGSRFTKEAYLEVFNEIMN